MAIRRRRTGNRLSDRTARLAQGALDPARQMDGEDLASRSPEQVQLWQEVYLELIQFDSGLLATLSDSLPLMSNQASIEIRELDLAMVEAQQARYRDRLEFWRRRGREMQPLRLVGDP
jgi:hypothetical protein